MKVFFDDIRQMLLNCRFWWLLAWLDIRMRYRRSAMGPWWITLTTAIQIGVLVLVFSQLFGISDDHYMSWLTIGMISWSFVNATIIGASNTLIKRGTFLKERPVSHFGLILADVLKQLLALAHLVPIYLVLQLYLGQHMNGYTLQLLFSVPMLMLALLPLSLIISYISVRFRDFPPLVNSVMNACYFLTPIIWLPEQLGDNKWLVQLNPITWAVAMIREPLLGQPIGGRYLLLIACFIAVAWFVAIFVQERFKKRVVYWV